jgi:hypothetical protein
LYAKISESYWLPVLEAVLHQFPFRILGFHADNGSEYINHRVAGMLNKLLAEITQSRSYKSQDNALVEGKNGAVIRKHIGWGHIRAEHAETVQKFYTAHFNPYLNDHRPCGFATVRTAANARRSTNPRTMRHPTKNSRACRNLNSTSRPVSLSLSSITSRRLSATPSGPRKCTAPNRNSCAA